jgi:parallel beta-helix repeat protein
VHPSLADTGLSFEIRDLVFQDFEYGIHVTSGGGVPNAATVEEVLINHSEFRNNRRGIYLQDSLYKFQIRDNTMVGAGAAEPAGNTADAEAGVLIENTTTQSNTFTPIIANNTIGGYEQYGIGVVGAKLPGLTIEGNTIGADVGLAPLPNAIGINIVGSGTDEVAINRISNGNKLYYNDTGVLLQTVNSVTVDGNTFQYNVQRGLLVSATANSNVVTNNEFISNMGPGVVVGNAIADGSIRDRVSQNHFRANSGLPIDLGSNGAIEANDYDPNPVGNGDDTDSGPNQRLNYPEVKSVGMIEESAQWRIPVHFDAQLSSTYRLEFYRYIASTNEYAFIKYVLRDLSATNGDLDETFVFQKGTEIQSGDKLATLAIVEAPGFSGDTSELVISPALVATKTAAPTFIDLVDAYDTGVRNDDNITNRDNGSTAKNLQFVVFGTVPGATVNIFASGTLIGTAVASSTVTAVTTNGASDLGDSSFTVTARQTSPGLTGSDSTSTSLTIDTAGPRVSDLVITTTASAHPQYDFATATYNNQPVIGSGNQLVTVPVGGADQVSLRFNEAVTTISQSSLTLLRLLTTGSPTLANTNPYAYAPATITATWTFSAPLAADWYIVSLVDTVRDVAGNQLDGEWINPFSTSTTNPSVSHFPSGDGFAGGPFNFVMTILPGDADRDNQVSGSDFFIWQSNSGPVTGKTYGQADFTGDGLTNGSDLAFYQANTGMTLRVLVFADFDLDGVVTTADYVIWQPNNGGTNKTHAQGDADNDTDVDGTDYLIWQRQLGYTLRWVA